MIALPDPTLPWPIPMEAVALIAEAESLQLKAYRCPAGVWTVGWGRTDGVKPGDTCTKDQADQWLCDDLATRSRTVQAMCTNPPADNEIGAMVSLAYNVGTEALRKSTVLRQHNAGNHEAAARAFGLWDKARNPRTAALEVFPGLTARRARETALYLTPDSADQREAMPQAVDHESSMTESPINRTGAAATTAGVVATLNEARDKLGAVGHLIKQARDFVVDTFGIPGDFVLPVVLIACGLGVIWWRNKQRNEGRT
jgi:lysozyme